MTGLSATALLRYKERRHTEEEGAIVAKPAEQRRRVLQRVLYVIVRDCVGIRRDRTGCCPQRVHQIIQIVTTTFSTVIAVATEKQKWD